MKVFLLLSALLQFHGLTQWQALSDELIFSWNFAASNDCDSNFKYNIISDCGTCPTVTNMITAACSDLQLTTNAVVCHFRVSSVVCGHTGNPSPPLSVTLKVPNVPQVNFVPSYSNDSQALEKIFIITAKRQPEDLFYVSGDIPGFPTSYNITIAASNASNRNDGSSFESTLELSTCNERIGCPIELPFFLCSESTSIAITVAAVNMLGVGPRSNPFIIECMNNFVQVEYKESTADPSISCVFQNLSDISEKECCIAHKLHMCDQKEVQDVEECDTDLPYRINLKLGASVTSGQRYCFTAIASNSTYTMKVEGSFIAGFDQSRNDSTDMNTAIIAVVVSCFVAFLGVVVIILCICVKRRNGYQLLTTNSEDDGLPTSNSISDSIRSRANLLKRYLKRYHLPDTLRLHKVGRHCELRKYVTNTLGRDFKRGHAYYEFTNEVENIPEGKEVLLQDKQNTNKWFRLVQPEEVPAGDIKFCGEGIPRSTFGQKYKVFIQSFGSGTRHLPRDSYILYNCEDQVELDVLPLVPVCSEHFAHRVINSEEECTVEQFCTQNGLKTKAFNVFLAMEHLPEGMRDQPPRDAILMNRKSRELFTGPFARRMSDSTNGGELQHENKVWKVFALLKQQERDIMLKRDSEVLYQDLRYANGKYTVLEVDEESNNTRMSKFIETKLDCQFEDKKAFYRAEEKEDLLYYKKILRPKKEQLRSGEQLELQTLVEYFYANEGVPSEAVQLKKLRHRRIFIQSTSQGSKCLKKGDKLLYLREHTSCNDLEHETDVDPEESVSSKSSYVSAGSRT